MSDLRDQIADQIHYALPAHEGQRCTHTCNRAAQAVTALIQPELLAWQQRAETAEATLDRIRALHHLQEWVSLSDVCGRHHWFRTVEPNPETIAVADVCPDCRPRRYMTCVCGDDPCPVLTALDQPKDTQET